MFQFPSSYEAESTARLERSSFLQNEVAQKKREWKAD